MRAGLQRHVHRRPTRVLAAIATVLQRRPLSVQPTELRMKPLTDHFAVTHYDSPHKRVRTDPPPPALSEGKRALQEIDIGG